MKNEQNNESVSSDSFENIPQNQQDPLAHADLITSVILFAFGLAVLITGIYIAFFAVTGADTWYYSPGMYPILLGSILMLFSILLGVKKYRAGGRIRKIDTGRFSSIFKSNTTMRLLLAVFLLAIYVFILIGRLPFVAATFLYLAATMIFFRKEGYAIWKLLIISAVTSIAIYLFFGIVALVPLP